MSTTQIAEIQDIQGVAYAVDADGERRQLKSGDVLFDGESVETSDGGVVELLLVNGQPLTIAGEPLFLISADLISDAAPSEDESALQAETLDELLAEGEIESLEEIIEAGEEDPENLDDLLASAEEDPAASGFDFDALNDLDATAAGGDSGDSGDGGSTIVQATRIQTGGDNTSATQTEGNTQASNTPTTATGTASNPIPVAVSDAFLITEDTASAGDLAENDALFGGETFALLEGAGPINGTLSLNNDGTFVYTPTADFVGEDSFQYVVTDPTGDTSVATVSLTVEPVNDVPVIVVSDVATFVEDSGAAVGDVVASYTTSDVDNQLVTVTLSDTTHYALNSENNTVTLTEAGLALVNDGQQLPVFGLTPSDDLIDGVPQSVEPVVISVNDAPTIVVTANSFIEDADGLAAGVTVAGTFTTSDAESDDLTVNFTPNTNINGHYSLDPESNQVVLTQSGVDVVNAGGVLDAISLTVTDNGVGALTSTASDTPVITGTNDAPEIVVAANDFTEDAGGLTAGVSVAGTFTVSDNDGDALSVAFTNATTHYELDSANNQVLLTQAGIDVIDAGGSLDPIALTVSDSAENPLTSTASGTPVVATINDAPVITVVASDFTEDSADLVPGQSVAGTYVAADEDNDTLTVAFTNPTTHYQLDTENNQVLLTQDGIDVINSGGALDPIVLTVIDSGAGSLTASASDAPIVTEVNDPPEITGDLALTMAEGGRYALVASDLGFTDQDDTAVTFTIANPENGKVQVNGVDALTFTSEELSAGLVTIVHDGSETTEAAFTVTVEDADGASSTASLSVAVVSVDEGPVAQADAITVTSEEPIVVDVLSNDLAAPGVNLSVTNAVSSVQASVSFNDDGTLNYVPRPGFVGVDVVTYTVSDGLGGFTTATVTVTVEGVNEGPVASPDVITIAADALSSGINVLGNDQDPEGGALEIISVTSESAEAGSIVTVNPDGTLNYQPAVGFVGTDTVTYVVRDASGATSTATVTVNVVALDNGPVAVDDVAVMDSEAVAVNIDVLGNDLAIDPSRLSIAQDSISSIAGAIVSLNEDGTLNYEPPAGFTGNDTITYSVIDGEGGVTTATLVVTVLGPNVGPTAVDDSITVEEDTFTINIDVLSNDTDLNNDPLTVLSASATFGTVTVNPNGTLNYRPVENATEADQITYRIGDGSGETSEATLTVNITPVNDAPEANETSTSTLEDTPIAILNVLNNVTDLDGDDLRVVSASVEPAFGGNVTINDDNTLSYAPAANYFGSDSITYSVSDGSTTATSTVSIEVIAVNDAPVVVDEVLTTTEDQGVLGIVVRDNDSDVEGEVLTITANETSLNGGAVSVNADGSINYQPKSNFNGTDTIEYFVTDASGETTGGAVLVTVTAVDDEPVASTATLETAAGVPIEGDLTESVILGDGATTFSLTPGAEPQHGVVTLNDDGTYSYTPDEGFSGIERFGYTVTDEDGDVASSIITISVVSDDFQANQPGDLPDDIPVAAGDAFTLQEDTLVTAQVGQNDDLSDDGGNVFTVEESNGPAHGTVIMAGNGVFTYTPEANFFGQDAFVYTLTDANGDTSTATVSLTIEGVNDAAQFEGDLTGTMLEDSGLERPLSEPVSPLTGTINVTDVTGGALEDTDVEGVNALGTSEGFRVAIEGDYPQPQNGVATIDGNGNWTYTPNPNFNGDDQFTVLVTDDLGNVESQVVNVTVEAVTDLASDDDAFSVDEDGVLEASVANNDSTISGGALTYALAAGATTANGELLFNEDGSYTYTPNTDYYGPDSFSYVVTDAASGESSTQAVTITVNPVVEANAITIDGIEGDSGVAGDFQTNDTTLTVSGSLEKPSPAMSGSRFQPTAGQPGRLATVDGTNWSFEDPTAQDASFTYEARIAGPGDSVGATAEQAVTIDTTPPVATIQLDDAVTSDNIINAQESGEAITISGSVGGDVRAGDTVTLTVNGVQSQGVVESVEGALRFSAEVQGADLVADDDLTIDAAITTTDDAGNISEVATDVQTYTVDLEAFATITVEVLPELEGVALENAIAVAAYRGDTLNITGVAGLDAADGGEITLTVNGNSLYGYR